MAKSSIESDLGMRFAIRRLDLAFRDSFDVLQALSLE